MLCDYKIGYISDSGFHKEVKVFFYEKETENSVRKKLEEQVFLFDPWGSHKEIVAYLNKYLKDHYGQGRQPINEQREE